jgi:hypothetical protein
MIPQSQALDKPREPHENIEMHVAPTKPRGFFVSNDHTHNQQNNCNSFFIVNLIALSFDTICSKKNHIFQPSLLQLVPLKGLDKK